jgi:uncharacterized C2H2 Zn-finger protein
MLPADPGRNCQTPVIPLYTKEDSSYTEDSISLADDDCIGDMLALESVPGLPSGVAGGSGHSQVLNWLDHTNFRNHGTTTEGKQTAQSSLSSGREQHAPSGAAKRSSSRDSSKQVPGDDNDNNERRKRRRKIDLSSAQSYNRKLACPFAKHNPLNHSRCWYFAFDDTGELKYYKSSLQPMSPLTHFRQHFTRYHETPIHCPICGQVFTTAEDRDRHVRQRSCEEQDLTDRWNRITEDQQKRLSKRKSRQKTDEQYWMDIYMLLFGLPTPMHPCKPPPPDPSILCLVSNEVIDHENFIELAIRSIQQNMIDNIPSLITTQDCSQLTCVHRDSEPATEPAVHTMLRGVLQKGFDRAIANSRNIRSRTTATNGPTMDSTQSTAAASSDSGLGSMQIATSSRGLSLSPIMEDMDQAGVERPSSPSLSEHGRLLDALLNGTDQYPDHMVPLGTYNALGGATGGHNRGHLSTFRFPPLAGIDITPYNSSQDQSMQPQLPHVSHQRDDSGTLPTGSHGLSSIALDDLTNMYTDVVESRLPATS